MSTLKSMAEECHSCGEELEPGQIGECADCQAEREDARVEFEPIAPAAKASGQATGLN